jgi:hypothetical protein
MFEFTLEVGFSDTVLLGFLHFTRPIKRVVFFGHSRRFLGAIEGEGGPVVAEG